MAQSCGGSLGDPVVNVTYGAGANPGAALVAGQTTYTYITNDCPSDGFYAIRNSTGTNNSTSCFGNTWHYLSEDHTPGDVNGYMMVVNASFTAGEFFKQNISGLCGGTTYEFSAWVINLLKTTACLPNPARPNLTFRIETTSGTVLKTYNTGVITESTSINWVRHATFFTTPTGVSTVVLKIINNAPGGCGNDIALDDIQFRACGPTLTATMNPSSGRVCVGQPISLSANISAGYNSPVYQWQQSTDGGVNWTNVSGATSTSYNFPTTTPGNYAFRILASENGNIGLVTCRIASTPILNVTVSPYPNLTSSNGEICSGRCIDLATLWTDQTTNYPTGVTVDIKYYNTLNDAQNYANALSSSTVCPTNTRSYFVCKSVNGCSDIQEIVVNVKPNPTVSISSNSPICLNQTLNLNSTATAGSTFSWVGPNGFNSTQQNPTITNATLAAGGTYSLTANLNGCTATVTTSVTIRPLPTVSGGSNSPICQGTTLNLTSSGTAGSTFTWLGPNGFTSTAQNPNISNVNTAATGTYTVTATLNACTATATVVVSIRPVPVVTATSNSPVCVGTNLSLTASGGATGMTYIWSGPNGFTSNLQNPTILNATTTASGIYTLTSTASGCSASSTTSVTVRPLPTASASSNSPICENTNLNLSGNGTAGSTYSWNGVNGFNSTLQNPSISNAIPSMSGVYTLTVTLNGCTTTATTSVTVRPLPTASASSNSPICENTILNLSGNGTAGSTYSWTGANGFNSTLQNPSISNATPSMSGVYTLTVTLNGCTTTATTNVTVRPLPTASASSNSPICENTTLNLNGTGTSGSTYSWSGINGFNSTLQNPTISNATPSMSGVYTLTVTLNGCTTTATTNVTVRPLPTASASSNSPICENTTLNLTGNGTAGSTYSWNGVNGFNSTLQNPTISNATPSISGVYTLTVTLNGCTTTATTGVTVKPLPTASANSNSPICENTTLNLTGNGTAGSTYSWNGVNGFNSTLQNPTISNATPSMSGVYTLTVTLNGCTTTATTSVTVRPLPTASASSNSPICENTTLNLTGNGTAGSTYSWNGVNGFNSTLQNPSINNATPSISGVYTLTVTLNGCTTTATTSVTVKPLPTASASSNSPICENTTLNLSGNGTAGSTYSWTGVNGFNSTLQNPSISNATPSMAGVYTLTVTLNGCTTTATTNVTVRPLPTATASSNSPICENTTLNLTGNGTAGSTYSWIGINGFNSTLQNPTISNATPSISGVYTLTVTLNGCTTTATTSVTVKPLPTASASSNSPICENTTLNLSGNGTSGSTYSWNGINGFNSTLQNQSISNATPSMSGVYTLTVTLNGCTTTATTSVTVKPLPTASASSNSPICENTILNLSGNGTAGSTYSWTGINGFNSTLQNPTISNATPSMSGVYTLTVTLNGCTTTATTSVTVKPLPTASASSNSPICENTTLNLSGNGTSSSTYSWSGVNGFNSTLQNPIISNATPSMSGIYTLTVTLNGCTTTATTSVTVKPLPTASASSNSPICENTTLNLNGTGTSGSTYSWTGVNDFNSTLQNPSISNATPSMSGVYTLTVTLNGCTTTATTNVTIKPLPTASVSSNSPICENTTLNLSGNGTAGSTYSWTGANGFNSTLQNPSISNVTPSISGIYTLTVTLNGCTTTATTNVTVRPLPTASASSNSPICENTTLNLNGTGTSGSTYSWSGINGFNSTLQNPTISNATPSTSGVYTLTVTLNGCITTATTNVTVRPLPTASASSNSPICENTTLNLNGTGTSGSTYSWSGVNGFNSTLQNPTISNATPSMSGVYTLTVTLNGCTTTATTSVTVKPLPTASASSNSPICENTTLNLNGTGTSGSTYSWNGANGFNSTLQNPTISNSTPSMSGVYTLTVTLNGCTTTATTSVTVKPLPTASASSNSPICENTTLNLNGTGTSGSTYSWNGVNGFNSILQNPTISNATPSMSGIYTLTVTLNGCTTTATTSVTVKPLPTASASSNSPICENTTLNLLGNATAGSTYSWNGVNGFNSTLQNPTISNATPSMSGVYTLTVTLNGCTTTATTSITVKPLPTASASSNSPICENTNLNLSGNGTAGSTYSWNGVNGFNSALQNPSISNATPSMSGVYTLTATLNGCTTTATTNVIIRDLPIAAASSNSPICEQQTLNLSAVTNTGASYSWTGPVGFGSTLQNPSISNTTVSNSGIYSLTVTFSSGCSASATTNVLIKKKPVANATNDSPRCAGQNLQLNTSTETGATYAWSGPNGFVSTSQNPQINNVNPINSGIYQVIVNLDGCLNSSTTNVIVYENPVANPSNNSPICEEQTLNFTAENAGVGAVYSWTGPNSFNSSLQNPSITTTTSSLSGIYTLTVSQNGCTSTATTSVTVKPKPSVSIALVSPLCATETLNLSATATSGSTFSWNGPNGFISTLQNPSIANTSVASSGIYQVSVDLNGCVNAATTNITVNPKPDAMAMANSPVCETETINLSANNAGNGATYSWTGPNGFSSSIQNPNLTNTIPSQSGIYSLLVTLGSCTSTTTVQVVIHPKPTLNLQTPTCAANLKTYSVNLTATGGAVTSSAGTVNNLGTNNYSISGIPAETNIVVTVTSTEGCVVSQNLTAPDCSCPVMVAPVSSGNQTICEGQPTPALSASVGANEVIEWFSTSAGGTAITIANTYTPTETSAGTYTYYTQTRNTITDCISLTRTAITLTIKPTPIATATSNSAVCENDTLKLFGNSSLTGVTYLWTGINGFNSTLQNPEITNSNPSQSGIYTLTIDLNGCTSTATTNVTVKPLPVITPSTNSPVCEGFNLNLSVNETPTATYSWTGPVSFASNSRVATLIAAKPINSGIYTITVTLNGCVNTATTSVTVNPKPVLTVSPPKCSVDLSTYAVRYASNMNGILSTTAGTIVNDSVTNIPAGTNIKLIFTSSAGCKDSISVNAPDCLCPTLNPPISWGDTATCELQPNPPLIAAVGTNETIDWYDSPTGGNLLASSVAQYTPTQTAVGTYTFYAETRRSDITIRTCVSSTRTPIKLTIKPLPAIAPLSNSPICQKDTVKLSTTTVSGATYEWQGPNGFSSTEQNPIRLNADDTMAGTYSIKVTLNGCFMATTLNVAIKPLPLISASSNANSGICESDTLKIETSPIGTALGTYQYSWQGPNGFTATNQSVSISPANPSQSGVYTITSTFDGCTATATSSVLIKPLPNAIANNTSPVCEGDSVILSAPDIIGATYEWFTPNGTLIGAGKEVVIQNTIPSQSGDYIVKITVNACSDTAKTNVIIKRKPIVNATGNVVCAGETIQLNVVRDSTSTYAWSGPNSFNSTVQNPIISNANISQSGIYTISLTLNQCTADDTASVTVKPLPNTVALSNRPVCEKDKINLTAENAGIGATYFWNGPNGFNSTLQNPVVDSVKINNAGIYTLTITLNGCTQTDTVLVDVKLLPQFNITTNSPVCEADTIRLSTLSVGGGLSGASYAWSGPNNFTANTQNIAISNANNLQSGIYELTVTQNGCSKTDTASIKVKPKPLAQILSNSPICEGDTLNLTAANAGIGASYLWNGANNFTSTLQNPTIRDFKANQAGQYILQVTLDGCVEYDTTNVVFKPLPILNLTSNSPVCVGDTIKLFSGGQDGVSYTWSGPDSFTSNTQNPIIFNAKLSQSGIYQVTAVLDGCFKNDSLNVIIKPLPIAEASSNSSICEGESLQFNAANAGAGAIYEWSGINGFASTEQNPIITNTNPTQSGKYVLKVTLDDCIVTDTIDVVINPKPTLKIDSAKCTPDLKKYNIYFSATGGIVSSSAGIVGNGIITEVPKDSAMVRVKVTTAAGCEVFFDVSAPDCNCPVISAPISLGDSTICKDKPIPTLGVTVGNHQTADWYDAPTGGNKIFTGLNFNPTQTDTFYVEARDTISNCKSATRITIKLIINEIPIFDLKATPSSCLGSDVQNNGKIEILNLLNGSKFDYSEGVTYTGNATYQTATAIAGDGVLLNDLANIAKTFTIRVFNDSGCFTDKTIELPKTDCQCPTNVCLPFEVKKTKSGR